MKPTKEQQDIIKRFTEVDILKVNAVAGSGKSSTLAMLAYANPVSSLYLAFNKAVADEAKENFPDHVDCRTTHSLAFSGFGRNLAHKLKRPKKYRNVAGTSSETAKFYKINDIHGEDEEVVNATSIASAVRATVQRYEQSDDLALESKHLPWHQIKEILEKKPTIDKQKVDKEILKVAKKLWDDRIDPSSPVLTTHDTYLKLWQLSNPTIHYDIIYLDEAQDTNPVVLDVVRKQKCKVVYVGDTFQSIYQFRGATNAMESVIAPAMLLTMSFRYGDEIANVARKIIKGAIDVKGNPKVKSQVSEIDSGKPFTKLFRTNSALFSEAVDMLKDGLKVKCEVDTSNYIRMLESAENLYRGNTKDVKHEEMTPFSTWDDLLLAAKENPELARISKTVVSGAVGLFKTQLKKVERHEGNADVILTTAHKSKGRQWDQVVIAEDFRDLKDIWENDNQQEINLLYVAVTRAVNTLELPEGILKEL